MDNVSMNGALKSVQKIVGSQETSKGNDVKPAAPEGIKRTDQAQISGVAKESQERLKSEDTIAVKDPVKQMVLNAEDSQQVDLVSGQVQKNQLESYQESYQATQGDDEKPEVIEIPQPTFYDKVAAAYKEQSESSSGI